MAVCVRAMKHSVGITNRITTPPSNKKQEGWNHAWEHPFFKRQCCGPQLWLEWDRRRLLQAAECRLCQAPDTPGQSRMRRDGERRDCNEPAIARRQLHPSWKKRRHLDRWAHNGSS